MKATSTQTSAATGGKWVVRSGGLVPGDNAYYVTTNGRTPKRIARLCNGRTSADVSPEESKSNGELMAAAPELLVSVRELLATCRDSMWAHITNATPDDPCVCKSCSIAKAEALLASLS